MEYPISFFEKNDYEAVKNLLWQKESRACEDCLLGLYVWKDRYQFRMLDIEKGHILHSQEDDSYLFPLSTDEEIITSIIDYLLTNNERLVFHRITSRQRQIMERHFPGVFCFEEDEGSFDYLYDIEALAELRGKKLSKKRNHINGFLNFYDNWVVEVIDKDNIQGCIEFAKDWYLQKEDKNEEGFDSLSFEKKSLFNVLENYDYLQADGVLLKIEGSIVAFSIGQRISESTYDVVFEKADEQIKGAYNIINREFVRYIRRRYSRVKYINRENDLGLPGLRKAKKSYMPCELLVKYDAKRI